jgi:hypothetical protein
MFLLLFPPYNETPDDDLNSFHIAEQVQKVTASVCASNMMLFSVVYVRKFIAKHMLCGVSCDDYKVCY